MDAPVYSCLPSAVIRAFKRGEIKSDHDLQLIADHLSACAGCESQLSAIDCVTKAATGEYRRDQEERADELSGAPEALTSHRMWKVLGKLGGGGAGEVWLARHLPSDALRAIKVVSLFPQQAAPSADLDKRMWRELEVSRIPPHRNLVAVYHTETHEPYLWFELEFVLGQDLEQVATGRPGGRLPVSVACGLLLQALAGLDHATLYGLTHRDLKPGNLMLAIDGTLKIADFGLAKIRAEGQSESLNSTNLQGHGTPAYCAPEQALSLANADVRSDLYSLGCVLYRLLAGHPPFGNHTGHTAKWDVFRAHQTERPPALSDVNLQVPAELSRVVDRMLAKNPDERYQTPRDAARALGPFANPSSQRLALEWLGQDLSPVDDKTGTQAASRRMPYREQVRRSLLLVRNLGLLVGMCVLLYGATSRWWRSEARVTDDNPAAAPRPIPEPAARRATVLAGNGVWRIEGDELCHSEGFDNQWLLFGDPNWTDYDFSFEARYDGRASGLSAIFRSPDDTRAEHFGVGWFGRHTAVMEYMEGGEFFKKILRDGAPLRKHVSRELVSEEWYRLAVAVRGRHAKTYFNGELIFEIDDNPFDRGRVGVRLRQLGNTKTRFRNFRIVDPQQNLLWEGLPSPPDELKAAVLEVESRGRAEN